MWTLLNSINTRFDLVVSCSVRTDTVGVNDIACGVSRHAYGQSARLSVSTSPHICSSVSADTSHQFRTPHIRSAVSTASHIRSSVSITRQIRFVSEAAKLFSEKVSECRRAPRPATMGFDGQELAPRWSIVECATLGFLGTVARTERTETALIKWRAHAPTRKC